MDVQVGVDLTPFIIAANSLTTNVCGNSGYEDDGIGSLMEMIERWLAAHFYTILDNQLSAAKAGTVAVRYQHHVQFFLMNSMYGQQAMVLDWKGNLAAMMNTAAVKKRIRVDIIWLGKHRCNPLLNGALDVTIEM